MYQGVKQTVVAACILLMFAPANVQASHNATVEFCGSPDEGRDFHDDYEVLQDDYDDLPLPGDLPASGAQIGTMKSCFDYDFIIPSDANKGDEFEFMFYMANYGSDDKSRRVGDESCGGWANNGASQISASTYSYRSGDNYYCYITLEVDKFFYWPGDTVSFDVTLKQTMDWECFYSDPIYGPTQSATCYDDWSTWTAADGSWDRDYHNVEITYTYLPA